MGIPKFSNLPIHHSPNQESKRENLYEDYLYEFRCYPNLIRNLLYVYETNKRMSRLETGEKIPRKINGERCYGFVKERGIDSLVCRQEWQPKGQDFSALASPYWLCCLYCFFIIVFAVWCPKLNVPKQSRHCLFDCVIQLFSVSFPWFHLRLLTSYRKKGFVFN